MVRTLWAGMATGTVVSAAALAAASLLAPPPPGRLPPAPPQQVVATPAGPSGAESAPALAMPKASSQRTAPEDAPQAPRAGIRPDAVAPGEAMPSATPAPAHPAAASGAVPVALPSAATRSALPEAPATAMPRQAPQAEGKPALAPRIFEAPEAAPNAPDDTQDPTLSGVTHQSAAPDAAPIDRQETLEATPGAAPQKAAPAPRSDAALRAYGARDTILAGRPVMSVIVIDQPGSNLGATALAGLPFPVSVAVDMRQKDARHRAHDYRSLGLEVLALNPDTALNGAGFAPVPEAVALLVLGHNQGRADETLRMLAADGRGLVLTEEDSALAGAARKAGVPAATVSRDLDGEGQGTRAIGRFLDQAAFSAGQDGAALLMVRLRPETLAALDLWAMSERAEAVQLRSVSALLLAQ